jgi:hypothetical protein
MLPHFHEITPRHKLIKMKNINFKTILPYLAAIVIFLVITIIYFSPLLEGKSILQSDIVNFKGMSKEIVDYRESTGKEALWTNSMFGGMPAYQISVKYTGNVITYFDKILTLGLPHPANLVFLYFLGFFILLLAMKVDPWLAVAGAIGFAFSSYFFIIIDAGHNSKAHAIAYMAPVMAGIILTMRKKYLLGGILTAVFLSLEIEANHPQITYYLLMIVVLYGIFQIIDAFRNKWMGAFMTAIGVLAIAATFAVLTNITSLWATYEYSKSTIRGKTELTTEKDNRTSGLDKDYVTQWSYGIGETMTLLIPDFYGGSSSAKMSPKSEIIKAMRSNNIPEETISQFSSNPVPFLYWGGQPFTSGPVYVGAIICFLFILGLFVVEGPLKWWLLSATLLSILLSWGHNFMAFTDFFLAYLPGYNKFRAVSMALVIAEFTMPLLGILAIKEIFKPENDRKKMFKDLQVATIIAGGLALLFAAIPGVLLSFSGMNDGSFAKNFPDWFMQAIRDERMRLVRMDALRSLFFILATAGIIWAVVYGKLKREYAFFILIFLFLADMYPVNKRYLNNDNFTAKSKVSNPFEPSQADQQILSDPDPDYRVYNATVNLFMDASTSYFHKSIGGYHGAKLRRYQELYDYQISKNNMAVLNMLNTKYFIVPDNNKMPQAQMNPGALGHAWFVPGYKLVDNADQELNALTGFNPADTAIVDKKFEALIKGFVPGKDSTATIMLESYKPNDLVYKTNSGKDALAVFSEIYYPQGWNAYVDGKPQPYFRANYVLRAMVIPSGQHTIEFRFEPRAYYVGEMISRISSIILLVLIIGLIAFSGWKAMKAEA